MVRTQIYLTEAEREGLSRLAQERGQKQSELIREAVDLYLEGQDSSHRQAVLERLAGIWGERQDLPDFSELRAQWDRTEKR